MHHSALELVSFDFAWPVVSFDFAWPVGLVLVWWWEYIALWSAEPLLWSKDNRLFSHFTRVSEVSVGQL